MDLAANFCYGTVTTAPSPANSGTSMVVTLLGGCTLPATPFNATVWITGLGSLFSNSEIVRVTGVSMAGAVATLTIVRAQETTNARTIVVTDQFGVAPTAKLVSDLITELAAKSPTLNDTGAGETLIADDATGQIKKLIAGSNVTLTPAADGVEVSVSAPGTGDVVGPAGAVSGNIPTFDGASGKLIEDSGVSLGDIATSISAAQAAAENASTPRAIMPATAPAAGQIPVGNAGGTAYAPVSVSGDAALASTGALTIAADAVTNAKQANMAANTVKVNATAGSENPADLAMAASTILARLASGDIVAATVAQLNTLLQLDGLTTAAAGFRGIPQTSVSAARTVAAADNGTHWYHPSADTTARTWTIDSNANLALPIGFTLTFINDASAGVITIAITSDTLVLAGAGTTGSRSLAANGIATIIKMTSTRWQVNGTGIT